MATELTVQTFGEEPYTFVPADADGMNFKNDGDTLIYVDHGGADKTFTQLEQRVCDHGHTPQHKTEICPSGETRVYLAKTKARFNDATGRAHFTLDDVTGVTVAAISYKDV